MIIAFITLIFLPIYSAEIIKTQFKITIVHLDPQMIVILGTVVAIFTLLAGITKGGKGAIFEFLKAISSAYYSYRVMNMYTEFVMRTSQAYAELRVDWGLWIWLVISITILSGIISALGKYAEKEEKKEKKKKEEEIEIEVGEEEEEILEI